MDEQQLRSAVVGAAEERLARLQKMEAGIIQQRNQIVVAMEQVTGELREIQGRIAELMDWIVAMKTGEFVEMPDGPAEQPVGDEPGGN